MMDSNGLIVCGSLCNIWHAQFHIDGGYVNLSDALLIWSIVVQANNNGKY